MFRTSYGSRPKLSVHIKAHTYLRYDTNAFYLKHLLPRSLETYVMTKLTSLQRISTNFKLSEPNENIGVILLKETKPISVQTFRYL